MSLFVFVCCFLVYFGLFFLSIPEINILSFGATQLMSLQKELVLQDLPVMLENVVSPQVKIDATIHVSWHIEISARCNHQCPSDAQEAISLMQVRFFLLNKLSLHNPAVTHDKSHCKKTVGKLKFSRQLSVPKVVPTKIFRSTVTKNYLLDKHNKIDRKYFHLNQMHQI